MIARVFPTKTSMTPTDEHAYYGEPPLWASQYEEVHVSCTFTWDIDRAYQLAEEWKPYCENVKVGGVAIDGEPHSPMIAGRYLKPGITITSRGCPKRCSFCLIKTPLKELKEFPEGNIVQDNNILACSDYHIDRVFNMLKHQKKIQFKGGLDAYRITDKVVDKLRSLRISELWLAFDGWNNSQAFTQAAMKLKKYFRRDQIRCFVLIGYEDDTIEKARFRLEYALDYGTMPFAMLYRDQKNTYHSKEWKRFQREWTRPAIIRSKL